MRHGIFKTVAKKLRFASIVLSIGAFASAMHAQDPVSQPAAQTDALEYASLEATHLDLGSVGQVLAVISNATVLRSKGKTEKLERGTLLFQGDTVDLGPEARATVRLSDAKIEKYQSVVTLLGSTHLIFDDAKADGPENLRDVRLTLEKGSLRVQVPPASDPVLPTFHVRMPTAKVNLKSGDAMLSLVKGPNQWRSLVQMIQGRATLLTDRNVDGEPDFLDIPEHEQGDFSNHEIPAGGSLGLYQQIVNEGHFSQPTDIDPGDLAKILKVTDVATAIEQKSHAQAKSSLAKVEEKKKIAQVKAAIAKKKTLAANLCQAPGGQFNQCAWTCSGKNPAGAKTCRTDLQGISCVRRICRADGDWKEETRLPSSEGDFCPAKGSTVHECGSYW